MGWFISMVVIGTSIGVIGFPLYLITRPRYVAAERPATPPSPYPPVPTQPSQAQRIEQLKALADLRSAGAISDREFERLKADVLS